MEEGVRDIRQAPFVWQSVTALARIRAAFEGRERATAIAVYVGMTEVANEHRSQKFQAFRARIAERAGTGARTVDRYAEAFVQMELLRKVETRKPGGQQGPNVWELLEPQPEVQSAADSTPQSAADDTQQSAADSTPIQQPTLEGMPKSPPRDEGNQQVPRSDRAQVVWDYFREKISPKAAEEVSPSNRRVIDKAAAEYPEPADGRDPLLIAIDGFLVWRQKKAGDMRLSSIFQSHPGGRPLYDHIGFWIECAQDRPVTARIPSEDRAIVMERIREVQRGHGSANPETVQVAKDAEQWLRNKGITPVPREKDGYPTFPQLAS